MRSLTAALWDILESKLQTGSRGHRMRFEVGPIEPFVPPSEPEPEFPLYGAGTHDVDTGISEGTDPTIVWAGYVECPGKITITWNDAGAEMYKGVASATSRPAFATGSFGQKLTAPWSDPDTFPSASELRQAGDQGYEQPWPTVGGQNDTPYGPVVGWVPMQTSGTKDFPNSSTDVQVDAGYWVLLWVSSARNVVWGEAPVNGQNGLRLEFTITLSEGACLADDPGEAPPSEGTWTQYPVKSVDIEKSFGSDADAMTVVLDNVGDTVQPLAAEPVIDVEQRVRTHQWYGDPDNAVLTFEGLVDEVLGHRAPSVATIRAKDRMKILLHPSIVVTDPQEADAVGAVRTPANYVWLNDQVNDIVDDLLDKAGWPEDLRLVTETNYLVDEFTCSLGESFASALRRLANLVAYEIWVDEDGNFVFDPRPNLQVGVDDESEEVEAVASFSGVREIYVLDDGLSDLDLKTRVYAFGPEATEAQETWDEVWHTGVIAHPNGLWHRPTEPGFIYAINGKTRRIWKVNQTTFAKTEMTSGALSSHATTGGMDGNDPTNESFVWVLETPFNDNEIGLPASSDDCRVLKVSTTTWAVTDNFTLGAGIYTSIRVTGGYIYVTRLDNQTIKKFDKTTYALSSTIDVSSLGDPTGLAIDGSELWVFTDDGTIHVVDESDPDTVIDTHRAPGQVGGGEFDSTDNSYIYTTVPGAGLIYKYQIEIAGTPAVAGESVDYDLEDALGDRARIEPRVHVGCPNYGEGVEHPYEIRLEVITDERLVSNTQAGETARRNLSKLTKKRRYVQFGIPANPGIQKGDPVEVHDPPSALDHQLVMVETYNTHQTENEYLGVISGPLWDTEY